ncbi:MAG: C10 family peptidase [Bacteroidales bacterium]|nr:C10 family peptidase [Bacteroidales bacterium]
MKKIILFVAILFIATSVKCSPVPVEVARKVAETFLLGHDGFDVSGLQLVYTRKLPTYGHPAFYVFAADRKGFVVVAGDDIAVPILGYSYDNPFTSDVPPNIAAFLDGFVDEIDEALQQDVQPYDVHVDEWRTLISGEMPTPVLTSSSVSPLISTTWSQNSPYNAQCPIASNAEPGYGGRVPVGCVATAMAQVIRYWQSPTHPSGWHGYQSSYGYLSVNFSNQTYNYSRMPNSLTTSSPANARQEVSKLLYHCGVALNMCYTDTASGAYVSNVRSALVNFFGFSGSTGIAHRDRYSATGWINMLKSELNSGRPMVYRGRSNNNGDAGHAFVCDGYSLSNQFHFNLGWGGLADGYYSLSAIAATVYSTSFNYSYDQEAIVGARPVSTQKKRFSQTDGRSRFYVDDTLEVYNHMAQNPYQCPSHAGGIDTIVIQPSDPTKQLLIEPVSDYYCGIQVYDGLNRNAVLLNNPGSGYVSMQGQLITSHNAVVIYNRSSSSRFGFRIIQDNGCRAVSEVAASVYLNTVALTWQENGESTQWQVEYGPSGFSLGNGTRVDCSSTTCTVSNLSYDSSYVFYVRSNCGNGQYGMWSERVSKFIPLPTFSISTMTNDDAMGYVTGDGTYDLGEMATLRATPYAGHCFLRWDDGVVDNPRMITVTASATYTAVFSPIYNIVVTSGDDIMGSAVGGGEYIEGEEVILTAIPFEGYRFVRWDDGSVENPRIIHATSSGIFIAFFEPIPNLCNVLAVASDSSMGYVEGGGEYVVGMTTTLTAVPNIGYDFLRWNDGISQNPRTIIVTGDASYVAEFVVSATTYEVSTNVNDTAMGYVVGAGIFDSGAVVTLFAVPRSGCRFVRWSDGDTQNPRLFSVLNNVCYTAIFEVEPTVYAITVTSEDASRGYVLGGGEYVNGTTAMLTAIPYSGYRFLRWSDGCTDNPYAIEVSCDASYTAVFEPLPYTCIISVTANDETMGCVNGGGEYVVGTSAVLTATPYDGYRFARWDDGDTNNPRFVSVMFDAIYTAVFEPLPVTYAIIVEASDSEKGVALGGGQFVSGAEVSIAAVPFEGNRFMHWNDGVEDNPRTITVYSDSAFMAMFASRQYSLLVESSDSALGVALGSGYYERGTEVQIVAVPYAGCRFEGWSDGIMDNPRTVVMLADETYVAYFARLEGIDESVGSSIVITVDDGEIVVHGVDNMEVRVYDIMGRCVPQDDLRSGIYLVKIGNLPARKIVVF